MAPGARFAGPILVTLALAGCADQGAPARAPDSSPQVVQPLAAPLPTPPLKCEKSDSDSTGSASALARAFDARQSCRSAEADKIRADFQAGRKTRPDAAAAMILIRARTREDIKRTRRALRRTGETGTDIAALQARLTAAERAAADLGHLGA